MRKKIAFGVGTVALTLGICFVAFNINKSHVTEELSNNTTAMASSDNDPNIETIASSLDMMDLSFDELNSVSKIIVKGTALEQSYYTAHNHVFSKTKIKVEKVYKGNVTKDEVLNIVEWGGITTEEEFNLKMFEEKTGKKATEEEKAKARSKKLRVLTGGIPYSEVGKSSVYFLEKASTEQFSEQIDNNTYTPIGVQGRFDIKNGNIIERPRGTDNELSELKITESDLEKVSNSNK